MFNRIRSVPNIKLKYIELIMNEFGEDHIYQNRNAEPKPIKNFCIILINFILVKPNGLRIMLEIKIIASIKKKNESKSSNKFK